jgi:hypothetical protein
MQLSTARCLARGAKPQLLLKPRPLALGKAVVGLCGASCLFVNVAHCEGAPADDAESDAAVEAVTDVVPLEDAVAPDALAVKGMTVWQIFARVLGEMQEDMLIFVVATASAVLAALVGVRAPAAMGRAFDGRGSGPGSGDLISLVMLYIGSAGNTQPASQTNPAVRMHARTNMHTRARATSARAHERTRARAPPSHAIPGAPLQG